MTVVILIQFATSRPSQPSQPGFCSDTQEHTMTNASRRDFLKSGAALAGAAALLSEVPFVHAGGDDLLRVGLIGCGGRGTGAAEQALRADKNVKLVAMGDAFRDKLESSLETLLKEKDIADKV